MHISLLILGMMALQGPMKIGEIELFGQTGLDSKKVLASLSVHEGDLVAMEKLAGLKDRIDQEVTATLGKHPTDVNFVGFDEKGSLMIFIGLPGPTVKSKPYRKLRGTDEKLPASATKLYEDFSARLMPAIQSGGGKEDDSNGYALFSDPDLRKTQLAMREFAPKNEALISRVLANSKSDDQRLSASMLIGYVQRSNKQISSLVAAVSDPNDTVRNNAVRALGVILRSDPKAVDEIPLTPFIDLVRSGVWTDRNKGVMTLVELSRKRDSRVLARIRAEALSSLLEIAHWRNFPHAFAAVQLLGRVAGIDESKLTKMLVAGDSSEVFKAFGGQ